MLIPVGRTSTATLEHSYGETFRCAHCGHHTPVVVRAQAQGSGVSPLFQAEESARGHAWREAVGGLRADA